MSVQAMSHVWDHSKQKGSHLLVMLAIANYAHADGSNAFPSLARLARDCRMSRRQIVRIVKNLEESGEIVVNHGDMDRPNHYQVVMDPSDKMSLPPSDKMSLPPSDKMSPPSDIAMSHYPLASIKNLSSKDIRLSPSNAAEEEAVDVKRGNGSADVQQVFNFWMETFGLNGNTRLTGDRKKKIQGRLKEGYSVEDIHRGILGCSKSSYHIENHYIDIALICRTAEKLDRFIQMASNGHVRVTHSPEKELPPRLEYSYMMSVQQSFPSKYGDRQLYEDAKQDWLEHYKKRDEKEYQLCLEEVEIYEASSIFLERFPVQSRLDGEDESDRREAGEEQLRSTAPPSRMSGLSEPLYNV